MHSRAQLAVSYGGGGGGGWWWVVGGWRDSKRVGGFRLLASYMGLVRQALVNHGDGSMVSTLS